MNNAWAKETHLGFLHLMVYWVTYVVLDFCLACGFPLYSPLSKHLLNPFNTAMPNAGIMERKDRITSDVSQSISVAMIRRKKVLCVCDQAGCHVVVQLFFDPVDCSPPGSSVHRFSQARIQEWVAISFSKGAMTYGLRTE